MTTRAGRYASPTHSLQPLDHVPLPVDGRHVTVRKTNNLGSWVPEGIAVIPITVHPVNGALGTHASIEQIEDPQRLRQGIQEPDAMNVDEVPDVPAVP